MKAPQRIYRTTDGRLVAEGHRDAAFLAYAKGDDVAAADEAKLPGAKSAPPISNKMASKPEDKSQGQSEAPKAADVRAWAEKQGLDVPARGKLPEKVVEAYLKREQ